MVRARSEAANAAALPTSSSLAARPSQKFRYERGKIGKIERAERFSVDGSGPVVAGGEQADESLGASNIAREQHRRDCCIILQR